MQIICNVLKEIIHIWMEVMIVGSCFLKGGDESSKGGGRGLGTGIACSLVLLTSSKVSGFDGLEEFSGELLLFGGGGQSSDGTTGFVHVSGEFVANVEPLLLGDVSREVINALGRFGKDGLLTGSEGRVFLLVKSIGGTSFSVNRVRRVDLG